MDVNQLFLKFEAAAQQSRLDPSLSNAPIVARINGPTVVIDSIVRLAVMKSGLKMDWSFSGGRGFIQSHEDAAKCRNALYLAFPQGDLTQSDL